MSGVTLKIRVSPGAKREAVGGFWLDQNGCARLVVRVAAPAADGRANAAVCAAIAAAFGLPKSSVVITAGSKSRLKTVAVETGDGAAFAERVDALMKALS